MQSQMYVPPLTKINKTIIFIYVGVFLLSTFIQMAGGFPLITYMGVSWKAVSSGAIWTLVSFPFVDTSLMTVIFNALILWFIGSELEAKWSKKFYIKFLAISTFGCGALYTLLGFLSGDMLSFLPLNGLTGTNLALLVAYALIYPNRQMIFMFIFPMKAKYFCLLLAGIELFMALTATATKAPFAHILAMLIGFIYLKYKSLKAQGLGMGHIWQNHKAHQARKKRGNLRLVKTKDERPDPEDPKYWQ